MFFYNFSSKTSCNKSYDLRRTISPLPVSWPRCFLRLPTSDKRRPKTAPTLRNKQCQKIQRYKQYEKGRKYWWYEGKRYLEFATYLWTLCSSFSSSTTLSTARLGPGSAPSWAIAAPRPWITACQSFI